MTQQQHHHERHRRQRKTNFLKIFLGMALGLAVILTIVILAMPKQDIESAARGRMNYLMKHPEHISWQEQRIVPKQTEIKNVRVGIKDSSVCTLISDVTNVQGGVKRTYPAEYLYVEVKPNMKLFDMETSNQRMYGECISLLISKKIVVIQGNKDYATQDLSHLGMDLHFIQINTVEEVAKTYRKQILKMSHINPKDPNLEECIRYHAAMLKIKYNGRMLKQVPENSNWLEVIKNYWRELF